MGGLIPAPTLAVGGIQVAGIPNRIAVVGPIRDLILAVGETQVGLILVVGVIQAGQIPAVGVIQAGRILAVGVTQAVQTAVRGRRI